MELRRRKNLNAKVHQTRQPVYCGILVWFFTSFLQLRIKIWSEILIAEGGSEYLKDSINPQGRFLFTQQ